VGQGIVEVDAVPVAVSELSRGHRAGLLTALGSPIFTHRHPPYRHCMRTSSHSHRDRFSFVMEQTLGHVAHSRNLERAVARRPDLDASVIRLDYEPSNPLLTLPVVRNWSLRASLAARSALRRTLSRDPVDAVFIHTQVSALLARAVMRAIPTVVSVDATPRNFDDEGAAYGHRRQGELAERLKLAVNRRALREAGAVVAWNRWARDSLVADYGVPADRVSVIPPGVDVARFRPGEPRPAGSPVRVLFVGGDFERKGGHDLLEAVRGLDAEVEVDMVTGRAPAVARAEPWVRVWEGLTPQSPQLVDLYGQADVFVLPTRGDCLAQVVAEAMASGLPVVTTRVGAMSEMVQHGVTGHLVPPRSPRALREALAALIADPAGRRAMGAAGLEAARRDHDAERNWDRIFGLMQELARTAGTRDAAADPPLVRELSSRPARTWAEVPGHSR
jgi:glycosyltransferase involved in cell wall biosynthesis